jgi:hypothetical protein
MVFYPVVTRLAIFPLREKHTFYGSALDKPDSRLLGPFADGGG